MGYLGRGGRADKDWVCRDRKKEFKRCSIVVKYKTLEKLFKKISLADSNPGETDEALLFALEQTSYGQIRL